MTTEIARLTALQITKKLPQGELKQRILDFYQEQTMCTICTSKNDVPRGTPLEFFNKDMNLYIIGDPGVKIRNIRANPRVSVSIMNNLYPDWPAEVWRTIKAAQITGEATLITPEHPEIPGGYRSIPLGTVFDSVWTRPERTAPSTVLNQSSAQDNRISGTRSAVGRLCPTTGLEGSEIVMPPA